MANGRFLVSGQQTGPLFVRDGLVTDQQITHIVRTQSTIDMSALGPVTGVVPFVGLRLVMDGPQPQKELLGRFELVHNGEPVWRSYCRRPIRYTIFIKPSVAYLFPNVAKTDGNWEVRFGLYIADRVHLPAKLTKEFLQGLNFKLLPAFGWEVIRILMDLPKLKDTGELEEPIDMDKAAAKNNVAVSMDDI